MEWLTQTLAQYAPLQGAYSFEPPCNLKRKGEVVLTLCLSCTVYFQDSYTLHIKQGVRKCVSEYLEQCGSQMQWIGAMGGSWKRFEPRLLAPLWSQIEKTDERHGWEFTIHGGLGEEEASSFGVLALGSDFPMRNEVLGHLHFRFPFDWFKDKLDGLADFFVECCERVEAKQGYGGLMLAAPPEIGAHQNVESLEYIIAKQLPILDIETLLLDSLFLQKGMKPGSWLTAVGEPWINQLGGLDNLRNALGSFFTFRPYPHGVVIQAGPTPGPLASSLGLKDLAQFTPQDIQAVRTPPQYRRLAQVLKPVRIQGIPQLHSGSRGKPYFDPKETQAWLARFD